MSLRPTRTMAPSLCPPHGRTAALGLSAVSSRASVARRPLRVARRAHPDSGSSGHATPSSAALEPSRLEPLPNALWLLDYMQDQWYDVRGPDFIIQRAESGLGEEAQAMRRHPASFMLLEGGVIDVSDFLVEDDDAPGDVHITPNTTCTGIVPVAKDDDELAEDQAADDVFFTDTSSPRRTKVIGFTCKCCGARNHSRINPQAFLQGTLVAQCASCQRWHKLSDHFGLFHDLKGPLFRPASALTWEDVPASLRPSDPELWEGSEHTP